jgi:hypothetical protein
MEWKDFLTCKNNGRVKTGFDSSNKRRCSLKRVLKISLVSVTILLVAVSISYSESFWQYDSDKYVSFKEKIELSWEYGIDEIDYFLMDIEVVDIKTAKLKRIIELVKGKESKQLIKLENEFRKDIVYEDHIEIKEPKDKRSFIDKATPTQSGVICFYQIYAIEETGNKKFPILKSPPAEISIIRLHDIF